VLSTVLCSVSIGTKSLWYDEGISVGLARDSLSQLWRAEWAHEENMLLYYLVLHLWIHLGDTEAELRSLSVIFTVATVIATFLLARRVFGDRTAAMAGFIMATAPFAIEFAQTVRGYTMAMFFAVLSTHLLLRALDRPNTARLALYVLSIVAAVYSQSFGVFVLVAQAGWVLARHHRPIPVRRLVVTAIAISALLGPQVALVAHVRGSSVSWISPLSFGRIKAAAYSLGGGHVLATALGGVTLAGAAVFLYRMVRGGKASTGEWLRTSESSLIVLWLVVPVVLTIGISIFKPLLVDYCLLICLPALAIVAARAIELALAAPARIVAVAGLTALGISGATVWYGRPSVEEYRAAAAVVADGHPHTVIEYPFILDVLNYYLQRDGYGPGSFRLIVAHSSDQLEAAREAVGRNSWFVNQVLVGTASVPKTERLLLGDLHVRTSNPSTIFEGHGAPAFVVTPLG
jgi:4-amino-4-deoxy-L-arabinose transferase-like glycosyltransferase